MRILHVVPSYLPARRYGGPIVAVHGLCRSLVELGAEVEVFTTDADGPGQLSVSGLSANVDGVRVSWFPRDAPRRLYRSRGLERALDRHVASFDLVHTHSLFLAPTSAAIRAARRAGVPWVVSPRGMLVPELFHARGFVRKHLWLRARGRKELEQAAFVHATSPLEEQQARRFDLDWPAFRVIPNGIHPPQDVRPEALAPSVRALLERPTLLFLGRLSWKKGTPRLVRALAELPDVELLLAGPDDEGLRARLETCAERAGVRSRVHLLGPVFGAAKEALLAGATALVLPSRSENFGNVVLEALAHATPVVTTPEVGAAEIVRSTGAGAVTAPDPDPVALARSIAGFLARPAAERAAAGARGQRRVLDDFAWSVVAAEMLAAYRQHAGRLARAA